MRITSPRLSSLPDGATRVSVDVGDFELWYEVPAGLSIADGGEFLAAAALIPSMARGEPLELPADWPIDSVFAANLDLVQEGLLANQEELAVGLHRIEVLASIRQKPPEVTPGALAFFSGGVDGSYTALTNRDRISRLLLLRGIDMQLDNEELWPAALEGGRAIAAHWQLPLAAISTNIRFLGYHHDLKWMRTFQGAGLASVAHLVPHQVVLIAASHSLENMVGAASNPGMDPLWSSSRTVFEHDGPVRRTTKLEALARDPVVLERLRVCWHDSGYNCCKCEKCLRTMIALRLLGAETPSFPQPLDLGLVDLLGTHNGARLDFIVELDDLERQHPDAEVRRALDGLLAAERRRARLRRMDDLTGGMLSALRRRLRG